MPGRHFTVPPVTRVCFAVNLAGFAGLVTLVFLRTRQFWWDETWYLASVEALRAEGLSGSFLRGLPGPAGPLYACVHFLLEPVTGLRPLPTRLANIGLFVLTIIALGVALRARQVSYPLLKASYLLAAPITYGIVGTALTELPAMLCFCLSLALLLVALSPSRRGTPTAIALAAAAGLDRGLESVGRQQHLMSLLAVSALAIGANLSARAVVPTLLVYLASASILPGAVFAVWGGLVPPATAYVGEGTSLAHLALSVSYAGLIYFIYDFTWIRKWWAPFVGIVLAGLLMNLSVGLIEHLPMQETAKRLLPAWALRYYSRGGSGLILGFGLAFSLRMVRPLFGNDGGRRYFALATLLLLVTPAKITHMFA
ncbi:hypothetical protein BH23PLA1_BH23PLA1_19120 [soil metagenome]